MIHNLIRAAHELIFNRKISNMNSNTVQGAIDELKGTLGYTKKNHFKYITDGFTYNGIIAQRNADGSMSVTGTATDTVDYQIGETIAPDNEQYILSGYTEGVDADCNIYAAYWEDDSTWLSAEAVLDDKGVLVTKAKGNLCKACLHVASGKTVNIKFYPMVRYASIEDDTFESYDEDVQTQIDNLSSKVSGFIWQSLTQTLGTESNNKPYLEIKAQINKFTQSGMYGGSIVCGGVFNYIGYKRSGMDYASFLIHGYDGNVYHVKNTAGTWQYAKLQCTFTTF